MNSKNQVCLYRMDTSPYSSADFQQREKKILEEFQEINYCKTIEELAKSPPGNPIIWITNTQSDLAKIPASLLSRTVLIIHPNSGYDNFSTDFVENNLFPILIGSEVRGRAVLEFILTTIMHHYLPLPLEKEWNPSRSWNRPLLVDKKIFLLGHGYIGKLLHQALIPLVQNITIYDPFQGFSKWPEEKDWDMIILCAGLNPTSQFIIDQHFLQQLGPQTLIINSARGKLIKEDHLMHFLEQNPQSFAYLDVHEKEPYDPQKWTHLKNIHLTSHIAGVFDKLDDGIINFEKKILLDFLPKLGGKKFLEKYQHRILKNRIEKNNKFLI